MTITEAAYIFHYGYAIGDCLFDNSTLADAFYGASTSVLAVADDVKDIVCGLINLFTGLLYYLDILVNQGIGAFVLQIFNDVLTFIQTDLVNLINTLINQIFPPEVIAILNQLLSSFYCFISAFDRFAEMIANLFDTINILGVDVPGLNCDDGCCISNFDGNPGVFCLNDWIALIISCVTDSYCNRRGANTVAGTIEAGQACVPNGTSIFATTCKLSPTTVPSAPRCWCYGNTTHIYGVEEPTSSCSLTDTNSVDSVVHSLKFSINGNYRPSFCHNDIYNGISICTALTSTVPRRIKNTTFGACCMTGPDQQPERYCSVMTSALCTAPSRWVGGVDCTGQDPNGVFIETPCINDCLHEGFAINLVEIDNDGIPDTCRPYYDLWMNESTDSKIYTLLQNQYEQCMFSYNVTSLINQLSIQGNIVDPLVLFHPRLMWNMFGNMTITAAYISSYLMSNMTMDEFIPVFLNTTNISSVPVMTYYAFGEWSSFLFLNFTDITQ